MAKTFPFLSLPAELRDQIYELALTNSDGITVVARTKAGRRTVRRGMIVNTKRHLRGFFNINSIEVPKQDNKLSPRLLEVNKQIRSEGVGWLYKQPIILESTMALHSFVATIGSTNRQIVTDLTIKGWGSGRGKHFIKSLTSSH